MNAKDLLRAVALPSRSEQDAIAEKIEEFLAGDGQTLCVNAETGVGKTLAYAAPAALAAGGGRKVVVSTHTTQQMEQVLAAFDRLAAALPAPVTQARRLGRANFLSPGRIARILANRDDLDEDARALLGAARAHRGLIDEFEIDHDPLPVPRADVCLTASCTDQRAYEAQRAEAGAADIVVQTHAMSVLDAIRGAVSADIAIYDEADALPAAAAGFAEARVTPLDLAAVAERYALAGLEDAAAAFEAWAKRAVGAGGVAFKQDHPEAVRHAEAVRAALDGREDEHARDLRRALGAFIGLDPAKPRRGAAVTAAPGGHAFEVLALDPARVLRRSYEGRKTLFVSATLVVSATHDEADASGGFEPFLRTVGGPREAHPRWAKIGIRIEGFGEMTFALADRSVPKPFDEDRERAPAFDDYAASVLRAAMAEGGRVLALAPSFADVDEIARRVEGVIAHRRGERLAAHLEAFKGSADGALVTPAAWAGTDLPGLLDHVVILRIPFPPPEAGRAGLLRRLLESRGHDGANAEGILFDRNRREAVRKLAQGLGRGIRGPDDRVKLWIADPRFPLPDALVLDERSLLSQGLAARHRYLADAIPRRFTDAYERAEILPRDA